MPKVIFKFDKERDLRNIWDTCNFKSNWSDVKKNIDPKIINLCQSKGFQECKKELEDYYSKIYNSELIEIFVKSINDAWAKINDEFFKRLKEVMKKPICSEEFMGYLTVMGRCPYNIKEKSFMVCIFNNIFHALKTTAHEIMHLQFHEYYWKKIEEEIDKEKTADLKEALTVLLNLEFKDLWFVEDFGYEPHKELRKFIVNEWKKKKDFDVLIDKCVEYLK